MSEEEKKFLGFHNKTLGYIVIGIMVFISGVGFSTIFYNYQTGFWFDTVYVDYNYYTFHPHPNDSCEILQGKLDLYHPQGTNPVKFELLKAMFTKKCEIELR